MTPAAAGAANTRMFLIHCLGRRSLSQAEKATARTGFTASMAAKTTRASQPRRRRRDRRRSQPGMERLVSRSGSRAWWRPLLVYTASRLATFVVALAADSQRHARFATTLRAADAAWFLEVVRHGYPNHLPIQ